MKNFSLISVIFVSFLIINPVFANNGEFSINLDHKTISKGYTVSSFKDKIKLSLVPGILASSTRVDVLELDEEIDMPWQLERISPVYQFEFRNKAAYDNHKPFYIQLSYDEQTNKYKQVYFFDKSKGLWRPLPTKDFPEEKFVRSLIHLPFARIAVFSFPEVLTVGRASWYAHKGGNFAASPDFPKGSLIRVYNADNGKYVDVTINDWGPDRSVHPDRPIDLDKVAFAKIASLSAGVINVKLEPLSIVEENGKILNMSKDGEGVIPEVNSEAGIVYNETRNQILWSKNKDLRMRLASLTKLVSMKIFLDTNPDLEKLVKYDIKDEKTTFRYVDYDYEATKLALESGTEYKINDLLHSSLIASTNNTVETLVRVSGLTRDEFIKRMNDSAKKVGAVSTVFVEPTGLSVDNYSTVYDYVKLMSWVMENKLIGEITGKNEHKMTVGREKTLYNTNPIVRWSLTDGVVASKTGFINEAGNCLAMQVKNKEGEDISIVTFNNKTKDTMFNEMLDLISYGKMNKSQVKLATGSDDAVDDEIIIDENSDIEIKTVNPFGLSDEEMASRLK